MVNNPMKNVPLNFFKKTFICVILIPFMNGPALFSGQIKEAAQGSVWGPVAMAAAQLKKSGQQQSDLVEALWPYLRDLPLKNRPRVALVLGGGGARGLAHIGVIKELEKQKVPIDMVVGTSVGALIGALYTAGVPIERIERMGQEAGWDKLTDLSTSKLVKLLVSEQLLSTKKMEDYVGRHIGNLQFADLKIPFACVATDLKTGEAIILREGSVALAARASATMPGLFKPVPYRHRLLVDGGLVANIPVDVAQILGADVIICVNVPPDFSKNNLTNVLTILTQAIYIQGEVQTKQQLDLADVVITPDLKDINALDLWRSAECIKAGIAATRKSLPELKKVLVKRFFQNWLKQGPPQIKGSVQGKPEAQ